jgi:hypothetical protein
MQLQFSEGQLNLWTSNFTNNEKLPFITCSALIALPDLEAFIAAIKAQKADSVRVYFLRFSPHDIPANEVLVEGQPAQGCKWANATETLTQATIALVPTQHFGHDKDFVFSADDIILNNSITALIPGVLKEGTCMNPPGTSGVAKPAGGH